MSRALLGKERTKARRMVDRLAGFDVAVVARMLSMRRHTVQAILTRRMLPGRTFLERSARLCLP